MKFLPSRPLYIQILFTALVFVAMVSLSYLFLRDTVHKNLVRNAESVFTFVKSQVNADLLEPRMMVSGFSQTIRSMLLRGDSAEDINNYILDIVDYLHSGNSRILSSIAIFGYFEAFGKESVFITSDGYMPPEYNPHERIWFLAAVQNCGHVVETTPYESYLTRKKVITLTRCIHDDNDDRLGIVGMNVSIDDIGSNVVNIIHEQGGYGLLIDQNLIIIAHSNKDFIGKHVSDTELPLSLLLYDFKRGNDIVEHPLVNWKGEQTVAFIRKIDNGWYLGLLMPERPFYRNLTNMASTLIILGVIFAFTLIMILIRIDAARSKSDRESRHKSQFLANMSHEIRTPMNAIIGMTTIGKSTKEVERKDFCFSKIEDAGNHLLGVINDILDMSKIEANKFDLSPSEFVFEKMLQRIVNVVNFRVDEKHQKLIVHIDKEIPKTMIGDDQRFAQVITNLLSNAIKFTPENGSINLDARFIEEKDSICTIQISVSDTGIGMTDEQQRRAFTSFEQAETSTTRKYGGTGLGLPISKSIVELMGGTIWMVSEIGLGSTFLFTVKMQRGLAQYQGLLSPDVNLRNVRIMAVDDDQDVLDYFKEIASEFNVSCDTANSGDEAIRLVEKNGHYHIYFVDWKMPGMDGIQLTAELKAHHESVKSVVIMITAAEWTVVEKEAKTSGVDKFLSKPLFPSSIANILNEALGIDYEKINEVHEEKNIEGLFLGRSILLVEDVEINREIVLTLLGPTSISVDCAENGKEALRMFTEAPDKYEIIFMDLQMPEMDGYEATRKIRSLNIPQAKSIRIIAMTANVFREDIERCLEAGMDNHIGKPLDFNEIIEKLNIYLPKRS